MTISLEAATRLGPIKCHKVRCTGRLTKLGLSLERENSFQVHFFLEPGASEAGRLVVPKALSLNKVGHGLHVLDRVFRGYTESPKVVSRAHVALPDSCHVPLTAALLLSLVALVARLGRLLGSWAGSRPLCLSPCLYSNSQPSAVKCRLTRTRHSSLPSLVRLALASGWH